MPRPQKTVCTGVEMFRKTLDYGRRATTSGCLLRGIKKDEVERGQVVAKPGSITPHTKFKAEVYVLTKEEGGRHTPFFTGYRPQFYLRTTDVTGVVTLPEGVEMVMPGDNVPMEVTLITPVALEEGLRFAIREGGRTVGAGVVSDIDDQWNKAMRDIITLACTACKRRNYTTTKNKRRTPDRLALQEVLPVLPGPYPAPGKQVGGRKQASSSNG